MPPPRHITGTALRGRRIRCGLPLLLTSRVAACVPHTPPTSPAPTDHTWQITGYRMPGVSALVAAAAERLTGHFIHLRPERASNSHDTCEAPSYTETAHAAGPFLDTEYRVSLAALGLPRNATVRVIEVDCGGQRWTALGGRVLSFGTAGDYAVWDGVFFRLRRVHL